MKLLVFIILLISHQVKAQNGFNLVSGCQPDDYVLADIQGAVGIQGHSYTPKCLKVLKGSTITITANKKHPLAPQNKMNNPIQQTESTKSYTFDQTGVYGYFCIDHGDSNGNGMAGTIWVVESF